MLEKVQKIVAPIDQRALATQIQNKVIVCTQINNSVSFDDIADMSDKIDAVHGMTVSSVDIDDYNHDVTITIQLQ